MSIPGSPKRRFMVLVGQLALRFGTGLPTAELHPIRGSKEALEHRMFLGADARDGVLTSIREWRTQEDSNLWPLPSEGSALSS